MLFIHTFRFFAQVILWALVEANMHNSIDNKENKNAQIKLVVKFMPEKRSVSPIMNVL
jgi:hypothetical protein